MLNMSEHMWMGCHGFVPTFAVSRPEMLPNSQPCFPHRVVTCSARAKKTTAKKRTRKKHQNPPEDAKFISDVSIGDEFLGKIAEVGPADSSWVDIDVFTKRGHPVHARLPFPTKNSSHTRKNVAGAVVPVYVQKVNREAGRIEVRRGAKPQHSSASSVIIMLDTLSLGDKLEGTVVGLGPYGAVLDANVYRNGKGGRVTPCRGLLQRRSFRREWSSAADKVTRRDAEECIRIGDTLDVCVRAAHVQNAFLLFDAYDVLQEDVAEERQRRRSSARRKYRRAPVDSLKVGEVRDGVVTDIARFGLFVDVGVKSDGLIHYSEMGERHKRDWKQVAGTDTQLTVEVLGVEESKISLRLVSVKQEVLREALAAAQSATARVEDVELAAALQGETTRSYGKKIVSSDDSARPNATHQVKTAKILRSDPESRGRIEDDDEGDEEEQDKFSDEYFEDKYGF